MTVPHLGQTVRVIIGDGSLIKPEVRTGMRTIGHVVWKSEDNLLVEVLMVVGSDWAARGHLLFRESEPLTDGEIGCNYCWPAAS